MTQAKSSVEDAPIAFETSDPEFRRNPYPRYAELRESDVLHRTPDGLWVLTRYDDVGAAVRDPRLSSHPKHATDGRVRRAGNNIPIVGDGTIEIMLLADAPDHTRLRRLANKAFTPRAVEQLRPRVQELVDGILSRAADEGGTFDVMASLAEPLPVMVICDLLGVPVEDQDQFKPWSTAIARMLDPDVDESALNDAIPAVMGFVSYFNGLIEERRVSPRDDLLSALIAAEEAGDSLSQGELFAMIILLFIAGHETTTNLIGNGTLALLRSPSQLAALAADPSLAVSGTEELLRYDSPVQVTARTATEDLVVNDWLPLAKGESVVCGLAAANRDPRYVDDPESVDLARGKMTHLSFSNGMHYCLGAPLARLEGQITFAAMATRFPSMTLLDDSPPYRDHFVLRGLASLPVALHG